MADVTYRANLSTPNLPVDPLTMGRSVIVKGQDQNYTPNLASKMDVDKDAGIAQAYYIANVLPTEQGYRSVGFSKSLEACPGTPYFAFPVRTSGESALLVHTREGFLYKLDETGSPQFKYVGEFMGDLSYATVAGITYIYVSKVGCYEYEFTTDTLLPNTLVGLDASAVLGITGTGGYLLAWSADAIAWSSLVDATDFIPSLDTGAGGGSVEGARGAITFCVPASNGILIFTSENCVSASLSNNARFPFNFREVVGSSGITDLQAVTFDGNQQAAYAFTSGGFQQISQNAAKPVWADLTDSASATPVWDENTVVDQTVGVTRKIAGAKLTVAGARYVCVSIQNGTLTVDGIQYPKYRDIWVFDLALQRWGRLVRDHLEVFSDQNSNLAIIDIDGRLVIAENSNTPDESATTERGVGTIVLGKYQYTRQRRLTLHKVTLDNLYHTNLRDPLTGVTLGVDYPDVYLLNSLTGKWSKIDRLSKDTYGSRLTELNHSIMIRGNFSLNTVILDFVNNGGR